MLPFLHHIYTIARALSLSLIHTNWLGDSFAVSSVLFVLLFLDYCSVILAVCGVIARISYNCIALKHFCCHKTVQHSLFAPTFFSILICSYIVFLLFSSYEYLCLHTIQHLFSLFLISYPYFVRRLFQFVWEKLQVALAQKEYSKKWWHPEMFLVLIFHMQRLHILLTVQSPLGRVKRLLVGWFEYHVRIRSGSFLVRKRQTFLSLSFVQRK